MADSTRPARIPGVPSIDVETLRHRVETQRELIRRDLERLVRIPSVSQPSFDRGQVEASALAVADLLRGAGLPEVDILRVASPVAGAEGAPAVVAHRDGPPGAPTVLLYAHHDVQPPGTDDDWSSPPFEPTERDGRLYGRGAADDKAGICVHLAALRALGDDLAVGVTVFVEGEEEIGSPTFDTFLAEHRRRLAADVIVVADSANWRIGQPALTTSLRGLVDGIIEVRTLDHAVHSGLFGGAVPDATTVLIRLLDSLWDPSGAVAVAGLDTDVDAEQGPPGAGHSTPEYLEADLRADAGVLDGVHLIGRGDLAARIWHRPALTIIGTDLPDIARASNTLQPSVRAKFSLRVPPGRDPQAAFDAVAAHLRDRAPWGAQVDVRLNELASPWAGDLDGDVYDAARWALEQAWGHPAVHMGVGGSIPFIASLQQIYPDAAVLVTGVEDPDTRAHGADESLHLAEFERACLAEALLLAALGRR